MKGATFQKEVQANAKHEAGGSMNWLRNDKEVYVFWAKWTGGRRVVKNKTRVGQQQGPDLVKHTSVLIRVAFILSEEEH